MCNATQEIFLLPQFLILKFCVNANGMRAKYRVKRQFLTNKLVRKKGLVLVIDYIWKEVNGRIGYVQNPPKNLNLYVEVMQN